jgi:hypothetical protein
MQMHPEVRQNIIETALVAGLAIVIFFLPHLSNLL